MQKLLAWLSLLRAGNCLIIALAAYTGYLIGEGEHPTSPLLLAVSAFLIAAGGNAINDFFDASLDAINKPWRPIPSGAISTRAALIAAIASFSLGSLIGFLVSYPCGLVAVLASSLLLLYSWRVKRLGLPGNFLIAFLSALNILYGALAAPRPLDALMPAAYAFLIIAGREVLKGLEDLKGDRALNVRTLAATRGPRDALLAATFLLLAVIVISPIPLALGFGPLYAALAFAGVDLPIVASLAYVWRDPVRRGWRATRILKVPLFAGLMAFLLGKW